MKKLFLSVVMLLFTAIMLVGATWAYWDMLQVTESEIIEIGKGRTVVVNAVAEVPEGKTLVPAGVAMGANDITEIVLTYNVITSENFNLNVKIENFKIGESTDEYNLVNIVVGEYISTNVNNVNQVITVTITLTEPANITEYNAIINKNITFDVVFTGATA